jgi:hypothetical protein
LSGSTFSQHEKAITKFNQFTEGKATDTELAVQEELDLLRTAVDLEDETKMLLTLFEQQLAVTLQFTKRLEHIQSDYDVPRSALTISRKAYEKVAVFKDRVLKYQTKIGHARDSVGYQLPFPAPKRTNMSIVATVTRPQG